MRERRRVLKLVPVAAVLAIFLSFGGIVWGAQTKESLVTGSLYRIHAGFLEVKTGEKNISVVKVDSGTVYWNGKTDKAASAKDLTLGDELAIEVVEKKGLPVAQKVRFLHRFS
jgi:hypothetical protein